MAPPVSACTWTCGRVALLLCVTLTASAELSADEAGVAPLLLSFFLSSSLNLANASIASWSNCVGGWRQGGRRGGAQQRRACQGAEGMRACKKQRKPSDEGEDIICGAASIRHEGRCLLCCHCPVCRHRSPHPPCVCCCSRLPWCRPPCHTHLGHSRLQVECLDHGRVAHQGALQRGLAKRLGRAVWGAALAQAARDTQDALPHLGGGRERVERDTRGARSTTDMGCSFT